MGKRLAAIIVVVIVIAAIVFGLTRNNNSNTSSSRSNSSNAQPAHSQQNNNTDQQQSASSDSVTIQNFAFMPPDITVKKGTTVTWTNQDSTTHTVSEMDGKSGPNSGNLNPGAKYSFTFNETGTFKYRCNIHPDMLGTVTVTD